MGPAVTTANIQIPMDGPTRVIVLVPVASKTFESPQVGTPAYLA